MPRWWRSVLVLVALLCALAAALSISTDVGKLGDRLGRFRPGVVALALALALGNYLVRFVRWELYLRRVGLAVPRRTSARVFFAGLAMSVTPGKLGELVKAGLLRDSVGAPLALTAPVVIAERLTDLVALVVLALAGVAAYGVAVPTVAISAAVVMAGLIAISWRALGQAILRTVARLPFGARLAPRLGELHANVADLVSPRPLAWATALAIVAWLCECLGFAVVVRSFPGAWVSLGLAVLIYAATTLAGALSFLPGGLLVTEASMVLLLVHSAHGLDEPSAVAATIVTRLCTLWFAVLLGLVALALSHRKRDGSRGRRPVESAAP